MPLRGDHAPGAKERCRFRRQGPRKAQPDSRDRTKLQRGHSKGKVVFVLILARPDYLLCSRRSTFGQMGGFAGSNYIRRSSLSDRIKNRWESGCGGLSTPLRRNAKIQRLLDDTWKECRSKRSRDQLYKVRHFGCTRA